MESRRSSISNSSQQRVLPIRLCPAVRLVLSKLSGTELMKRNARGRRNVPEDGDVLNSFSYFLDFYRIQEVLDYCESILPDLFKVPVQIKGRLHGGHE